MVSANSCSHLFLVTFAAWFERRQMKKIYSPLLEGSLALYLGFEWIQVIHELILSMNYSPIENTRTILKLPIVFHLQTNNILAPIITHVIYSAVILGRGLWKKHDHRRRLHQRIQQLKSEVKDLNKL